MTVQIIHLMQEHDNKAYKQSEKRCSILVLNLIPVVVKNTLKHNINHVK